MASLTRAIDSAQRGFHAWPVVTLLALGVAAALTETVSPTIIGRITSLIDDSHLVIGFLVFAIATVDRPWRMPWRRPGVAIAVAFGGCLTAGWIGGVAWPNSGDEYSYVYLADTLLSGHLTTPMPPDQELFKNFHVLVQGGRTFSPYPVGWSVIMMPFRALDAVWLVNPLLTVLVGVGLLRLFRLLNVSPVVQKPALALVILTPFFMFMGGSVFPQMASCAIVVCIVWAQMTDELRPDRWLKLLIGALFGFLLLNRYDVFAIVAVAYGVDRLVLRRLHAIYDASMVMLGSLPFVAFLLAYNFSITGSPIQLTSTWGSFVDDGLPGENPLAIHLLFAALKDLYWLGSLAQFGGLPVFLLAALAISIKIRNKTCRFYDFLLPSALVFYSFVPFTGGHQYGPRYWLWAWPIAMLTIVTGLVGQSGSFRLGRRHISFEGFSAACMLYASVAFCILLVTTHMYIAARRAIFDGLQLDERAIVLLPSRVIKVWPWQTSGIHAWSDDFTRNGLNFDAQVVFGRADAPDAVQRACRIGDRSVFRWEEPGRLIREECP